MVSEWARHAETVGADYIVVHAPALHFERAMLPGERLVRFGVFERGHPVLDVGHFRFERVRAGRVPVLHRRADFLGGRVASGL